MSRLAGAFLVAVVAACAHTPAPETTPAAMARRLAISLRSEDPRSGWVLLAPALQVEERYEAFATRWRATHGERARRAAAIERALRETDQVGERARLDFADGHAADLVRESTGWRLEAPLVVGLDVSTPVETLRMLAAAIEERSVTGFLHVLSSGRREDARRALDRFAGGLRAHLGDALDLSGDRAALVWHDGEHRYRVTLKRENGEWRVDDFSAQ
jgi:hypothetical protein